MGLDRAEARPFALPPQVDDFVDSLADNGANIELQLLYGNPMYTSPTGNLPDSIIPAPGSVPQSRPKPLCDFLAPDDARANRGVQQVHRLDGRAFPRPRALLLALE